MAITGEARIAKSRSLSSCGEIFSQKLTLNKLNLVSSFAICSPPQLDLFCNFLCTIAITCTRTPIKHTLPPLIPGRQDFIVHHRSIFVVCPDTLELDSSWPPIQSQIHNRTQNFSDQDNGQRDYIMPKYTPESCVISSACSLFGRRKDE